MPVTCPAGMERVRLHKGIKTVVRMLLPHGWMRVAATAWRRSTARAAGRTGLTTSLASGGTCSARHLAHAAEILSATANHGDLDSHTKWPSPSQVCVGVGSHRGIPFRRIRTHSSSLVSWRRPIAACAGRAPGECSEARPSLPSGQDHPPAQCEGSVLASRSSESWSPTTRAASEILVGVASQTRLRKATKIISVQSVAIVRPPREAAVLPEKLFP